MELYFFRVAEYSYLSEKANEERTKRPDYRPLIDHDSIHLPQSSNQVFLIYNNFQKNKVSCCDSLICLTTWGFTPFFSLFILYSTEMPNR